MSLLSCPSHRLGVQYTSLLPQKEVIAILKRVARGGSRHGSILLEPERRVLDRNMIEIVLRETVQLSK